MSPNGSRLLLLASLALVLAPRAQAMNTSDFRLSDNVIDLRDVPLEDQARVTQEHYDAFPMEEQATYPRTTDPDNLANQAGYWDIGTSPTNGNVDSTPSGSEPDTFGQSDYGSAYDWTSDGSDSFGGGNDWTSGGSSDSFGGADEWTSGGGYDSFGGGANDWTSGSSDSFGGYDSFGGGANDWTSSSSDSFGGGYDSFGGGYDSGYDSFGGGYDSFGGGYDSFGGGYDSFGGGGYDSGW